MNKLYLALDGDGAGQHVGQAVLMDDAQSLHDVSNNINQGIQAVKDAILSLGGQVVSSGGDELVAILNPENASDIENIRQKFFEITGFSASVGLGNSLSQAGKSLLAAKLTGKDKVQMYEPSVEGIIDQAHEAVQSGSADEEQSKIDEHYIDPIMDEDAPYNENESIDDQNEEEIEGMPEEESDYNNEEDSEDFYEENPEDMMAYPEGLEEDIPDEHLQHEDIVPDGDIPMEDSDFQESPEESYEEEQSSKQNGDNQDFDSESEVSDFEQEPSIELQGEEPIDENQDNQDLETEKADPEMAPEDASLDEHLADSNNNEELLQRIAANLDLFKQNKPLMDQIKQSKPELYSAMLGLLQNMIELARMIDPQAVNSMDNPEQDQSEAIEAPQEDFIEGENSLPKQNG